MSFLVNSTNVLSSSSEGNQPKKESVKKDKPFIDIAKGISRVETINMNRFFFILIFLDAKQKLKKAKLLENIETRILIWAMNFTTTEKDLKLFLEGSGINKSNINKLSIPANT
jgi:hypothetical protein